MNEEFDLELNIEETARNIAEFIDNRTFFDVFDDFNVVLQILSKSSLTPGQAKYILNGAKSKYDENQCFQIFKKLTVDFQNDLPSIISYIDTLNQIFHANTLKSISGVLDSASDYIYRISQEVEQLRNTAQDQTNKSEKIYGQLDKIAEILNNPKIDDIYNYFSECIERAKTDSEFDRILKFLCDSGINQKCSVSLISYASAKGNLEMVKFLHSKGANPEIKSTGGNTPLHFAAFEGHLDVVKYLLSVYCDKNARNGQKQTPLDLAIQKQQTEVVDFLTAIRAEKTVALTYPSTPSNNGWK